MLKFYQRLLLGLRSAEIALSGTDRNAVLQTGEGLEEAELDHAMAGLDETNFN